MNLFGNAFSGWHLILILAIVVLLFGAAKLPALAKSVGESMRIFRAETRGGDRTSADASPTSDSSTRSDPAQTGITPPRPTSNSDLSA